MCHRTCQLLINIVLITSTSQQTLIKLFFVENKRWFIIFMFRFCCFFFVCWFSKSTKMGGNTEFCDFCDSWFFFCFRFGKRKVKLHFFVHILILASTIKLDSIKCHQVLLSTTTKVAWFKCALITICIDDWAIYVVSCRWAILIRCSNSLNRPNEVDLSIKCLLKF